MGRLALALMLALAACTVPRVGAKDAPILVIGDSILMWNGWRGGDAAHHISRTLGVPVENRAVADAHISTPRGRKLLGRDIAKQYEGGRYEWVVLTGGGNDLGNECGCNGCAAVLDALISDDGQSGEIPDLVRRIRADGARVLYATYYGASGRGGAYDICAEEFVTLAARAERMSEAIPGVRHLSLAGVIGSADPSDYARDDIHPSPSGSRKIGEAAAAVIRGAPWGG